MYRFVPQERTQIEVASDTVMKSCRVIHYILAGTLAWFRINKQK